MKKLILSYFIILITQSAACEDFNKFAICQTMTVRGFLGAASTCHHTVNSGEFQLSAYRVCQKISYKGFHGTSNKCLNNIINKKYIPATTNLALSFSVKGFHGTALKLLVNTQAAPLNGANSDFPSPNYVNQDENCLSISAEFINAENTLLLANIRQARHAITIDNPAQASGILRALLFKLDFKKKKVCNYLTTGCSRSKSQIRSTGVSQFNR